MSEFDLQPLIVLHVPQGHETDPQALDAFREYANRQYGASVLVNPRLNADPTPAPILLGHWGTHLPGQVSADLQRHVERIFFNLDWLNLEGAR